MLGSRCVLTLLASVRFQPLDLAEFKLIRRSHLVLLIRLISSNLQMPFCATSNRARTKSTTPFSTTHTFPWRPPASLRIRLPGSVAAL